MGEVNRSMRNKKLAQRAGLPRRLKDMSKEQLETALLKKKECNARALIIVERLLENTVDEDWFLECLKFISDSHFQDIIEERVILRLCGYALCHQSLKNIPTQQYRISTKLNKVYDISERKNFCSNQCYKASKYIKDQLLTSPLWLRDTEEIPVFKVLPLGTSGTGAGEEVDFGQNNKGLKEEIAQLQKDDNFTSIAQYAQDSLSALSKKIDDSMEKKERKNVHFKEEIKSSLHKEKPESSSENMSAQVVKSENHTSDSSADNKCAEVANPENETSDSSADNKCAEVANPENETSDSIHVVDSVIVEDCLLKNSTYSDGSIEIKVEMVDSSASSNISTVEVECKVQNSQQMGICDLQTNTESVSGKQSSIDLSTHKTKIPDLEEHKSQTLEEDGKCCHEEKVKLVTKSQKTHKKIERKERTTSKSENKQKKKAVDVPQVINSIIHIEKCLHEWFTIDSMCFLLGEEKVKEMVLDKGECINEYYKIVGSTTRDAAMREKYEAICRRLNLLELEENKFDTEVRQMKPLPDYTILREESKKMQIKVRAFFQGSTDFETPNESPSKAEDVEVPNTVLPLVDLHAQNALRRRIVLDRLNRILPDLLRTFGLSSRDITTDLRALFCTFTLAAHNITFKPAEWNFLGLVIIKMLSIRDMRLKLTLDTEQACKYQTMMLMVFNQDGGYLDRLMAWLTDIDSILQKQTVANSSESTPLNLNNI